MCLFKGFKFFFVLQEILADTGKSLTFSAGEYFGFGWNVYGPLRFDYSDPGVAFCYLRYLLWDGQSAFFGPDAKRAYSIRLVVEYDNWSCVSITYLCKTMATSLFLHWWHWFCNGVLSAAWDKALWDDQIGRPASVLVMKAPIPSNWCYTWDWFLWFSLKVETMSIGGAEVLMDWWLWMKRFVGLMKKLYKHRLLLNYHNGFEADFIQFCGALWVYT